MTLHLSNVNLLNLNNMKTNFNLLLSCLIFFSAYLNAQNIDPVLADSLQAALERAVDEWQPIGLSVAVNFGEGDVWAAASGTSNGMDTLGTHHVFPLASITKTITSACIVSMVDEGLLSFEDTIGTWISGYPQIDGNIRVYQLLNHTSGIFDYLSDPNYIPTLGYAIGTTYTATDMLDLFLGDPYFAAGEDWSYSNTNYLLLGMIIESITGEEYHTVVRERVLAPHGFDDIVLLPQESPTGPLPGGWMLQQGQVINIQEIPMLFVPTITSSAWSTAAYAATPTDISEWARQLYSGVVLGDATDSLYAYNIDAEDNFITDFDIDYGLGVFTGPIDAENTLIGHGGNMLMYQSLVYYVPEKNVSFAMLTNDGTKLINLDTVFLELYNECVEYQLSTNTETAATAIDFSIHPNPADEQLFVTFDTQAYQTIKINLYHTNGQLIKTLSHDANTGAQQVRIDVSDLASGVYLVELMTETGTGTQNVIVR